MAKITQWEDSLTYRTDAEVQDIEKALDILKGWELFENEFEHMATLRVIVGQESSTRFIKYCDSLNREITEEHEQMIIV